MSNASNSPDARIRRLALVVLLFLAVGALAFVGVTGWPEAESPPTSTEVPADVTTPTARAGAVVPKPTPAPSTGPTPPAEAGETGDDSAEDDDPSPDSPSPTAETTPEDLPDSSPARSGGSTPSGDSDDPTVDVGGSTTAHGGQEVPRVSPPTPT
jgi:hypothetical protein